MLQQSPDYQPPGDSSRRANRITWAFALIILTPSMIGFVMKFYEFVHTFQGDAQGAFAITPMINYLLASLGFLCLLVWSAINGMFRDMEAPKQTLLVYDAILDGQLDTLSSSESPQGDQESDE